MVRKRLTTEEFIEKANKIHDGIYDYSLTKYVEIKSKIIIICYKHGQFEQTPDSHLRGKGCSTCKLKYSYDFSILESENDINSYLLGAFITDGCIHKSITRPHARSLSLDSADYDWLENIKNIICPNISIYKDRDYFRLSFNQIKFVDWFMLRGVVPAKSLITEMPQISELYFPDFLRGCLDGDGCIGIYENNFTNSYCRQYSYVKPECYISSASETFINQLYYAIINLGFIPCLTKSRQKTSIIENRAIYPSTEFMYYIKFGGNKANDFLKWIYYPDHKLSMPRKLKLAKNIMLYYSEQQ